LHDAEHPAVEACSRLELVRAGKRPFARRLDKIVRFDGGAGQATGESPKPGQDRDELVVE